MCLLIYVDNGYRWIGKTSHLDYLTELVKRDIVNTQKRRSLHRITYILLLGVETLGERDDIASIIVGYRIGRLDLVRVKGYILPNCAILLAYYTIVALILHTDTLITPSISLRCIDVVITVGCRILNVEECSNCSFAILVVLVILRSEEEAIKLICGTSIYSAEGIEVSLLPILIPVVTLIPLHALTPIELIPILPCLTIDVGRMVCLMIHHLWIAIIIDNLCVRHSELSCLHHHLLSLLHIATLYGREVVGIHLRGDERKVGFL